MLNVGDIASIAFMDYLNRTEEESKIFIAKAKKIQIYINKYKASLYEIQSKIHRFLNKAYHPNRFVTNHERAVYEAQLKTEKQLVDALQYYECQMDALKQSKHD